MGRFCRMRLAWLALLIPGVVTLAASSTMGQDSAEAPATDAPVAGGAMPIDLAAKTGGVPESRATGRSGPAAVGRASVMRLVTTGNPMLWPLALCSVVALGFALERLVALRR